MERNGFNASPYETSGKDTDDSSKKEKDPDKKKSKRPVAETGPSGDKKEHVAERTKGLLDKFVRPEISSAAVDKPVKSPEAAQPAAPVSEQPAQAEAAGSAEQLEADVDVLTPEEQAEVVAAYAPARISELKAGRSASEEPADAAAREADIAYLESMLPDDTEPVTDPEVTADDSPGESDFALSEEAEAIETADAVPEEQAAQDLEDDEPVSLGSGSSSGPHPATSTGQGSHGGGGGSGQPPRGRSASAAAQPAAAGPPRGYNLYPSSAAQSTGAEHVPDYRQNPNATYLLVGGIVGYFIGRRRGRIKTEKRLKVVQQKLEKQVAEVQSRVAQKEVEVQKLARERYWEQKRNISSAFEAADVERAASKAHMLDRPRRPEAYPHNGPESRLAAPERQRDAPRVEVRKQPRLTKEQVLATGEKVKVGTTNLKRIYEAKLISEAGLERLVYEHLEHGDIRRGLAREFLAKELSYERDPHFRDLLPLEIGSRSDVAGTDAASSAAITTSPAAAHPAGTDGPTASTDQDSQKAQPVPKSSRQVSNGLLTALIIVAIILAAYAVLLGLSR